MAKKVEPFYSSLDTDEIEERLLAIPKKVDKSDIGVKSSQLTVKIGDKTYIVPVNMKEVVAPNKPTISTTSYSVVSGSVSVLVTNNTVGATVKYKVGIGDWQTLASNIVLQSGFSQDVDCEPVQFEVSVKAEQYDIESESNEYTITITPKVGLPSDAVSVSRNQGDWSSEATVTLKPSATFGAESYYSTDGGTTWVPFNTTTTIRPTSSKSAGAYVVKAIKDGYTESDHPSSPAFTLNAKPTYIGFSDKATLTAADIKALTGGDTLNAYGITAETQYNVTSGSSNGYIWICQKNTLSPGKIYNDKDAPFPAGYNDAIVVDGLNCYRITNMIVANTQFGIYLKK